MTEYTVIDTPATLKPMQAYLSLSLCYTVSFLLSHVLVIAPFAPAIGLVAGCGSIYLFSKGFH